MLWIDRFWLNLVLHRNVPGIGVHRRFMRSFVRAMVALVEIEQDRDVSLLEAVSIIEQFTKWSEGRDVNLLDAPVRELHIFVQHHLILPPPGRATDCT